MAGVIELFEHYPAPLVARAVSPVYGLPAKYKFMPRIAEIKEWLDEHAPPSKPKYLEPEPPVDRTNRPSYEEIIATLPDSLRVKKAKRSSSEREIAEFRKAHNISDEQWNSTPDAK